MLCNYPPEFIGHHATENRSVGGSIPSLGTIVFKRLAALFIRASAGRCARTDGEATELLQGLCAAHRLAPTRMLTGALPDGQ